MMNTGKRKILQKKSIDINFDFLLKFALLALPSSTIDIPNITKIPARSTFKTFIKIFPVHNEKIAGRINIKNSKNSPQNDKFPPTYCPNKAHVTLAVGRWMNKRVKKPKKLWTFEQEYPKKSVYKA